MRGTLRTGLSKLDWAHVPVHRGKPFKGVQQDSILGPLLFNVLLRDIFHFVLKSHYKYPDDNTVALIHKDLGF